MREVIEMEQESKTSVGAVIILALGVAAGAAALWMLNPANKEKVRLGFLEDFEPKEFLERAARSVQHGTDRLIAAIEQAELKSSATSEIPGSKAA